MRALMLVGGGILIGVGLAYGEAAIKAEKKVREAEEEANRSVLRTLEAIGKSHPTEAPAETEEELYIHEDPLTFNPEGAVLIQGDDLPLPQGYVEEYVQKAAVYGDNAHMVETQVMEVIDDDQYAEEDGRAKEQIQVFMGEGDPYFVQDGMVIEDWQEKIGDNILVMFYQNFTPDFTGSRVIYIRNNERGEDFEVLQEMGP